LALLISCGNKNSQLEKKFFNLPAAERSAVMRSASLEDQYKIFRYGMDKREPPASWLAEPIAARGSSAIPFLTEQLESSADDAAVRDILLVLRRMAEFRTYDVKRDTNLTGLLHKKISSLKSAWWRNYCEEDLQQIMATPYEKGDRLN